MSNAVLLSSANAPSYVEWRGEILARLAWARVPGLILVNLPRNGDGHAPDVAVMSGTNHLFDVEVRAFSSTRLGFPDWAVRPWRWEFPAEWVRRARESTPPVLLFVFDADGEMGRYVRLDAVPEPAAGEDMILVELPIDQAATRANLEKLVQQVHEPV